MDAIFKKFVNTGVGFIAQGNKALQATIDKLVKESKISEKEGQKIMDGLMKSGDAKRADLEKQFTKLTDGLRDRVGSLRSTAKKATTKSATSKSGSSSAKKPASSPTAKAAGAVKKAADKTSDAADKAKRSAAAKAGAAKKKEAAAATKADNKAE